MKKSFLDILFFLILVMPLNAVCQDIAYIEKFPLISSENQDLFMSGIKEAKPLRLIYPSPELVPQDKLYSVWAGNRPRMISEIKSVKLTFSNKMQGGSFDFEIIFSQEGIVVKHSNPVYPNETAGFRFGGDKLNKQNKLYYRGKNKQSLVVFMPAYAYGERARGALLCQRDFSDSGSRSERASLQDSGYEISNATAVVSSEMNAYLKNPIDYVLAQAKLIVSPGVTTPVHYFDQSYAKDASVALVYKEHPEMHYKNPDNYSDFSLGVQNYLNLHLSSGYERVSRQMALVFIKKVDMPKGLEVPLQTKDILGTELETELKLRGISLKKQGLIGASLGNGSCYLVLYQVLPIIHEYLKEELVVPAEYSKLTE